MGLRSAVSRFIIVLILLTSVLLITGGIPQRRLPQIKFPYDSTSHPQNNHDSTTGEFLLGAGRADITGPVVEVNLMGYADNSQFGTGLRQRLYCRAFIIGSKTIPAERILYLILDTQSGDTAVRDGILRALAGLGEGYSMYTKDNVAVTGTHSHAGPGAWLNYLLPQITSRGFSKESFQALVDGSVLAIRRAHTSLVPGRLSFGSINTTDINISRSPYAYLANPAEERAKYQDDVDKEMTMLRFERAFDSLPFAFLTWIPVHGTSLYQNNTLVAGDNKGVAAYLSEEYMREHDPDFVAGFSQANVGDTSPNTLGPFCEDTGLDCDFEDSTCGGKTQPCHGRGPFFRTLDQGTKSCFEIGSRQFRAAMELLASKDLEYIPVSPVSSFHFFADMSNYTFPSQSDPSRTLRTCSAALGYGFAGGTTDGPGAFDFTQGTNDTDDSPSLRNPLWKAARAFIHSPSEDQIACQSPKPVLLDVGAATHPYAWTPNIVDIQLMRVGPLIMIIAPGEATTMAGRRWREAVASEAPTVFNVEKVKVVLGGPANTYAHYIATEEEYGVQRYEGASTLYGPHTLAAYISLTLTNLAYLGSRSEVGDLRPLNPGPDPPINVNHSWSFIRGVVVDSPGIFHKFGEVVESPTPSKTFRTGDIATARFIGANPRNNLRLEGTYAAVELFNGTTSIWQQVRSDRDWFLVYKWERKHTVLGTSEVRIEWEIEPWTQPGMYRIRYYGDSKSLGGEIKPFEGTSDSFQVAV